MIKEEVTGGSQVGCILWREMELKCVKHFSRGRISGEKNITAKPIQFAVILLIATSLGPSCVDFLSAGEEGTGNGWMSDSATGSRWGKSCKTADLRVCFATYSLVFWGVFLAVVGRRWRLCGDLCSPADASLSEWSLMRRGLTLHLQERRHRENKANGVWS